MITDFITEFMKSSGDVGNTLLFFCKDKKEFLHKRTQLIFETSYEENYAKILEPIMTKVYPWPSAHVSARLPEETREDTLFHIKDISSRGSRLSTFSTFYTTMKVDGTLSKILKKLSPRIYEYSSSKECPHKYISYSKINYQSNTPRFGKNGFGRYSRSLTITKKVYELNDSQRKKLCASWYAKIKDTTWHLTNNYNSLFYSPL